MMPLRYGRNDMGGGRRIKPFWDMEEYEFDLEKEGYTKVRILEKGFEYENAIFEAVAKFRARVLKEQYDGVFFAGFSYNAMKIGATYMLQTDSGTWMVVDEDAIEIEEI